MRYLDFGCEINFQSVKVDAAGRLGTVTRDPIVTAPYFQLADRRDGADGDAQARAQVSHFLVRPFPGHEWNHLLVYYLQDRPIQVARMIAHGLGETPPDETAMRPEPAPASVRQRSLARLDGFRGAYVDILGKKTAARFAEAGAGWMGGSSFVADWHADTVPDPTPATEDRPAAARPLRQSLDFTYLHVSFAAEAMLLVLDVLLLARMGEGLTPYVTDQGMQDPLFLRLGALSATRMAKFLKKWHRQRYGQFDPFTRTFVRSLGKLRVCKDRLRV